MALPVSDNFNRADESPIAFPWVSVSVNPARLISSAAWRGGSNSYSLAYWQGDAWPANQYSQCIAPGATTATKEVGPAVRVKDIGDGYYYKVSTATIYRIISGFETAISSAFSDPTPSQTLPYKLEIIGSTLNAYKNGVLLGSTTDTTITQGNAGFYCGLSGGCNIDNFNGGIATETALQASIALTAPKPTIAISAQLQNNTASIAITTTKPTISSVIIQSGSESIAIALTTQKPFISISLNQANLIVNGAITTLMPTIAGVMTLGFASYLSAAITTSRPNISITATQPQNKPQGKLNVQIMTLIKDALTMLMVYSPDINLTADEEQSALRALNMLIDSLANESLTINAVTKENFTLKGGQQAYIWESGSPDFNSVRPISIKACTVAISGQSGNTDFPVSIIQYDDWAAIKLKTLQTNYPQYVYMDGAWPGNNVLFYPIPSSNIPCTIYSYKAIANYTDVYEFIELPQGYYRMLVALLATELAPSYQLQASDNIISIGLQAKKNIMRTNYKPLTMATDTVLTQNGGRYNIFNDQQGGRG
jgi:hypothetical protein